ncbi:hypothetical protein LOD99_1888 [Oopsacas minuta]|uniref:DUSP domain-containing protein n=1 Tax=Oopsacas minuta TaxID=111878 RepID=A0AAV7K3L3_9METZ|nr:hypothetical protein LOD99_1888 [Oopsacas minuta]
METLPHLVPPLLSSDLDSVSKRVEEILMTEALSQYHLSEREIYLMTEMLGEMCRERDRELRMYSLEFSELSGAAGGWRRGRKGDSSNNPHLISIGEFLWDALLALIPTSPDRLTQPVIVNDTFDTKLCYYVKMTPPNKRTQRSLIDPLSTSLTSDSCYLINSDWYSNWETWVDSKNVKRNPTPIDNRDLRDNWRLTRSLIPHFTVKCLRDNEFIHLLSWFGLLANSIAVYVKGSELDLYPITIKSCVYGGASNLYRNVCITKDEPVRVLVDKIKFCFGIESNVETRVFIYFDRHRFYQFEDTSRPTAQLFPGQIVQLQIIRSDGTWEERSDVIPDIYSI